MREWYDQKYFDDMEVYAQNSAVRNARRLAGYRPESVLDVGCGHGYLVENLLKRGIEAWGTDWVDFARRRIPDNFIQAYADKLPFGDKSFDVVVSTDFLEHIPEEEVGKVFSEMVRVAQRKDRKSVV